MGTIYAIANQKGGVGKTTTAVNVAACIAEAGYATLLVDIDPQANATVGLGLDEGPRAQRLRRPVRLGDGRGGAVDDRHRQPRDPALTPRSGGGQRRAPARARLRAAPARGPGAAARPLRLHAPGLPAVARPADRQRAGGGRSRDRPGPDRVLRPRGPRRPARHAEPHPARAQPAPGRGGDAPDHARRAHPAGPRRRARGARALPAAGLRHRDPAQRAPGRGAELRAPGDPSRPALRAVRRPTSSWPRR